MLRLVTRFILATVAIGLASAASAATISVDGNACTLAEAIVAANTNAPFGGCRAGDDRNSGGDTIELRSDVVLTEIDNFDQNGCANGLPAIISTVSIRGHGRTISRSTTPGTPNFRILDSVGGRLGLERVTVRNGLSEGCDGGGINADALTLTDSVVADSLTFGGNGGGICGTDVVLVGSRVANNWGSGLHVRRQLMLLDSIVTNNRGLADNTGGGVDVRGSALIAFSTISNNWAGGSRAVGGGLYVEGTVAVHNSTLSANRADGDVGVGGGVLLFSGQATFVNSTISGNVARGGVSGVNYAGSGGGVFSSGRDPILTGPGGIVRLVQTTVVGNRAEGPFAPPGMVGGTGGGVLADDLLVTNSIIAMNSASNAPTADCQSAAATYLGMSLVGDGGCDAVAAGQLTGDPRLGILADNGGPTETHMPLAGSPVIDRIRLTPEGACSASGTFIDQRRVVRAQRGRPACDIGAVEFTGGTRNTTNLRQFGYDLIESLR